MGVVRGFRVTHQRLRVGVRAQAFATGVGISPSLAVITPEGVNIQPQGLNIQPVRATLMHHVSRNAHPLP